MQRKKGLRKLHNFVWFPSFKIGHGGVRSGSLLRFSFSLLLRVLCVNLLI